MDHMMVSRVVTNESSFSTKVCSQTLNKPEKMQLNKVTLRARLEIALAKKIVQLACPQLQIQIMVGPGPIFLVIFSNLRLFWAIF